MDLRLWGLIDRVRRFGWLCVWVIARRGLEIWFIALGSSRNAGAETR